MTNKNIETTRRSAVRKLHPNIINTSTSVRSLLGYLLRECWTEPFLIGLQCGRDGMLNGWESNNPVCLRLLCSRDHLIHAVLVLAQIAELTPAERTYLLTRVPPKGEARLL